jgi:hypothetical protein
MWGQRVNKVCLLRVSNWRLERMADVRQEVLSMPAVRVRIRRQELEAEGMTREKAFMVAVLEEGETILMRLRKDDDNGH